jgi:hypothetical protein
MQVGLATVASTLQANGGTATMNSEELSEWLENNAASIESSMSLPASSLNFECLSQDLPNMLQKVSDILMCASGGHGHAHENAYFRTGQGPSQEGYVNCTCEASIVGSSVRRMAVYVCGRRVKECWIVSHASKNVSMLVAPQQWRHLCSNPSLPQETLGLYKAQLTNSIEHENDSKIAVASRKVRQLLYGKESLYARTATVEGVASMTRADVQEWLHAQQRMLLSPMPHAVLAGDWLFQAIACMGACECRRYLCALFHTVQCFVSRMR